MYIVKLHNELTYDEIRSAKKIIFNMRIARKCLQETWCNDWQEGYYQGKIDAYKIALEEILYKYVAN